MIRLPCLELLDIPAKALEDGMPCQTLITSVLHKCVADKLAETGPAGTHPIDGFGVSATQVLRDALGAAPNSGAR